MHFGFRIRALTLVTAGVCLAAACGPSSGGGGGNVASADKQVLRVNIDTEPGTLDPAQQQWVYEADVGRNVFEALTRPKADLSDVEGAAASSWNISSDGRTWTFKIRSGEKYSDGTPVTASDFVTTYKRIFDPTIAAVYEPYFEIIKNGNKYSSVDAKDANAVKTFLASIGVSAPDASTFVITLENPAPWFKWVTSLWLAAPIKQADIDAVGSANYGAVTADAVSKLHGNGAFKISEIVPKDHITLVPNPQYRTQPKLQKVIFYYLTDANVEFAKFQNGEVDITRGVPSPDVPTVLGDPKLSKEVLRGPTLLNWWIDFNTTKAPLDNADLRLALAKSIDRGSYIKNVRKGIGIPSTYFIPNGERGYEPSDTQNFDCTAAKGLLAKAKTAGVTDAQLNSLHYMYAASSARKPTAEYFQQQWQQCLGINVTVDAVESKTFSRNLRTHSYWIGGVSGWQADYPDGQDWMDIFLTGSGNQFSGWSNKQYDDLVNKGDLAPKQTDRDNFYSQAQKILTQEAPVMFLYQDEKFLLINSKVKGWTKSALDDDWIGDVATSTQMYIST
jgi:ABC-type oligopeptide transport system substrate-binding subunit